MSVVESARRLVGHTHAYPVLSVYVDLDPERFATPPARASQIRSLLDEASRAVEGDRALSHADRQALREDIGRVSEYLLSREPPFKGARALAVFCSLRDELFEVVQLTRPAVGLVVVERTPYVEPMIGGANDRSWCVALVSRRSARIFSGPADRLQERVDVEDDVHGQHDQGGWSQANYERSYEKDVDDHLRRTAEVLRRRWRQARFDRLALGGPVEIVPRLEAMLPDELRAVLVPRRVDVDLSVANEDHVRGELAELIEEDERARERDALDRLVAGLGTGGRAAGGPDAVLGALHERRVEALLLEVGFDCPASRCPACGLLGLQRDGICPADGTALEAIEHLREAVVEAALGQDAEVIVVSRYSDLGPHRGIGAVLRF